MTTVLSVALAAPRIQDGDGALVVATIAIVGLTVFRTVRPLRYGDELGPLLHVLGEAAVTILAVVATGYWESPLVFSALTAVAVAGFARGFGFGIRVAVMAIVAVTAPWAFEETFVEEDARTSLQWSAEVLLVGIVSGYARRISGEAEERQTLALDRLGRLSDANTLLFQLHQVTQSLPASLDLDEALDTTVAQLGDLFTFDAMAILLYEESEHRWHTVRREGTRPPARMHEHELPPPLSRSLQARSLFQEPNLLASGGPGLSGSAASGMYACLTARGSVLGLISLEHGESQHFTHRDAELFAGFVEPAALAIDNARWFARLRTVGADEERTRIARDLHDRIGQSLAYLAFELDRIVKSAGGDAKVAKALDQLRGDVRGVIREVRDTLYDLRTDVTDAQSLPFILESFLDRVRERSGLEVGLRSQETGRLPILQEREMWRIAQEAVTNVERHARAAHLTVTWRCDGARASLEVADDGVGFPPGHAGRLDSYGILGMRERAASIGATLDVESRPGKGTRVRCVVTSP
ncbi:MAG: histidine kinase [Acidimicrobiia bacterium]